MPPPRFAIQEHLPRQAKDAMSALATPAERRRDVAQACSTAVCGWCPQGLSAIAHSAARLYCRGLPLQDRFVVVYNPLGPSRGWERDAHNGQEKVVFGRP